MTDLHQMKCAACRGGEPILTDSEINELIPQVPEWQVKEVNGVKRIERVFKMNNFIDAVAFINKIGLIAEKEDHHPLIVTEYGRVTVNWWTQKLKGCTRTISSWLPRQISCSSFTHYFFLRIFLEGLFTRLRRCV